MTLSLQEKNRRALHSFLQWRQEKLKRETEEEELLPSEEEPEELLQENSMEQWILKY